MTESRNLKVIFGKNGTGKTSTRITLPLPWLRQMNINENDRQVNVSFDGKKIIIEKADS